ncbi:MAG: hypothetical protein ACRCZI_10050 [Cetobacterium sp.]
MYKLLHNTQSIQRLIDGAIVPADINNQDFAAYLRWVAQGNTAANADPLPPANTRRADVLAALQDVIDEPVIPAKLKTMATALRNLL